MKIPARYVSGTRFAAQRENKDKSPVVVLGQGVGMQLASAPQAMQALVAARTALLDARLTPADIDLVVEEGNVSTVAVELEIEHGVRTEPKGDASSLVLEALSTGSARKVLLVRALGEGGGATAIVLGLEQPR